MFLPVIFTVHVEGMLRRILYILLKKISIRKVIAVQTLVGGVRFLVNKASYTDGNMLTNNCRILK